jgi:sugar-specific transcriptional regulator TrmB
MYQQTLQQIGLNEKEAIIYETILESGPISAREIFNKVGKKTNTTRSNLYNILTGLKGKKLLIEKGKKGKTYFEAESPAQLLEVFEGLIKKNDRAQKNLAVIMPELKSLYNLTTQKPIVQFFEGLEGIKKVLADSLNARTTIYTYADIEAIVKHINDINEEYVEKRDKLGIKKKAIIIDSKFARDYLKNYHRGVTDIRFIDHKLYPFNSVMQIYDKKISYITLSEKGKIGVIIEDPNIYQLNKSVFENTWAGAKIFNQLPPLSKAQ